MLKNKLIYQIFRHICGRNYHQSEKILYQTIQILQQNHKSISPIFIIETAIFNLLIPIRNSIVDINKQLKFVGNSLKQSIIQTLFKIIKYAKYLRNNQNISYKLAIIFFNLYKKEHILYKQKNLCINKFLHI